MEMRLLFIQPVLNSYRIPLFEDLSKYFDRVNVFAEMPGNHEQYLEDTLKFGLFKIHWSNFYGFKYYSLTRFLKISKEHQYVIHFADFKYITLYIALLSRAIYGTKVFVHGQGGFKKIGLLKRLVYTLLVGCSNGYIAYNEYSAQMLKTILPKFLWRKVSYVNNTLYVKPVQDINYLPKNEVAYIGRLREGSNIDMLVQACKKVNIKLNIVGFVDIENQTRLLKIFGNIVFHGPIFDEIEIKNVLSNSLVGVYAGDAGLSVVHFMSLGLPVIVHSDLKSHMGPEPAYIVDGVNGLLFSRFSIDDLMIKITKISTDLDFRNKCAQNALNYFNEISLDTMAKNFATIVKGDCSV